MAPEEVATALTHIRALETGASGATYGTAPRFGGSQQSGLIGTSSSAGKRRREPGKDDGDSEGGCGAIEKECTAGGAADSAAAVQLSTRQLRKLGSPKGFLHEPLLSELPSESDEPDLSRPLLEWRVEAVCVRVGQRMYRVPLS